MEFFRFKQVWTFRKLLQEFCEQITSLFQKFFFFVAEVLLFGKTGYVQARKAFDKTGSKSQEMLVATSDLERLSCFRMNTINDKNDVVPVSFEIVNREMPRNVICIAVSFQSKEFSSDMFGSVSVRCVHVLLLLLLLLLRFFGIVLRGLLLFLV